MCLLAGLGTSLVAAEGSGRAPPPTKEVVIASANVTSLDAHWHEVCQQEWDVLLVQEARVSPDAWSLGDAARKGISVQLGRLAGDGKALVCAIARSGCLAPAKLPPDGDPLRMQSFTWYPGRPCSWRL